MKNNPEEYNQNSPSPSHDEIVSEQLKYHLISVLEQLCYDIENDEIFHTHYNADAYAAWYLSELGYIKIIKGSWPQTKFLDFEFTEKAKNLVRVIIDEGI